MKSDLDRVLASPVFDHYRHYIVFDDKEFETYCDEMLDAADRLLFWRKHNPMKHHWHPEAQRLIAECLKLYVHVVRLGGWQHENQPMDFVNLFRLLIKKRSFNLEHRELLDEIFGPSHLG